MLEVIKISTTWCGPCKVYGPVFEDAAKQFGNVTFTALDADSDVRAKEFCVRNVPTTLILKDDVEVHRVTGALTKETLTKLVKDHGWIYLYTQV
jgi:thiol-disulfide isomerase/thioredoxin